MSPLNSSIDLRLWLFFQHPLSPGFPCEVRVQTEMLSWIHGEWLLTTYVHCNIKLDLFLSSIDRNRFMGITYINLFSFSLKKYLFFYWSRSEVLNISKVVCNLSLLHLNNAFPYFRFRIMLFKVFTFWILTSNYTSLNSISKMARSREKSYNSFVQLDKRIWYINCNCS